MARSLEMNFIREILRMIDELHISQREKVKVVGKGRDAVSNVIKMAKEHNITYAKALKMNDMELKSLYIQIIIHIETFQNQIWNGLIRK